MLSSEVLTQMGSNYFHFQGDVRAELSWEWVALETELRDILNKRRDVASTIRFSSRVHIPATKTWFNDATLWFDMTRLKRSRLSPWLR